MAKERVIHKSKSGESAASSKEKSYRLILVRDDPVAAELAQQNRIAWGRQTLPHLLEILKGFHLALKDTSKNSGLEIIKRNLRLNRWMERYLGTGFTNADEAHLFFTNIERLAELSAKKKRDLSIEEREELRNLETSVAMNAEMLRSKGFEITDDGKIPFFIDPLYAEGDIDDWMSNTGKFEKASTFTKGYTQLLWVPNQKQMKMGIFDIDVEDTPEREVRPKVIQLVQLLTAAGYAPDILWTGKSYHVYFPNTRFTQGTMDANYTQLTDQVIKPLSAQAGIPLRGTKAHQAGEVMVDYVTQSPNRPIRSPLSIHKSSGLAAILLTLKELDQFDPKRDSYPSQVDVADQLARIELLVQKYR